MTEKTELFPPLAISTEPTTKNATGSWRFERPVFVERTAPCAEACPLGQDIKTIMALAARGNRPAALDKILLENPFPGLCGRICPARCERACNRGQFDQPVSIKDLELFAAGAAESGLEKRRIKTDKKIALLGSGPAIWSAAWFLYLLGHEVVLFADPAASPSFDRAGEWDREREKRLAGKIVIESGPWPQIKDLISPAGNFDAFGTLDVPGRRPDPQIMGANEFRRRLKEKSISPPLDAAIIGCGPQVEKTADLLREQGIKYSILTERSPTAGPDPGGKGKVMWNTLALGLSGEKTEPTGLVISRGGDEFRFGTDLVILALGSRMDPFLVFPRFVSGIPWVELQDVKENDPDSGLVEAMARAKGAALALDLALRRRPIEDIARCMVGKRGAVSFEAYLDPGLDLEKRPVASFNDLNTAGFTPSDRIKPGGDIYGLQEARAAAARCFNCGLCTFCGICGEYCPDLSINIDPGVGSRGLDYDHCKGCGICAEECPSGAIGWVAE